MDLDDEEEGRNKSVHRRSRSQSISARARRTSSSRRGSPESIELDTEGAKFTTDAFRKRRQTVQHYGDSSSDDGIPSESELVADIERMKNEKEELLRTKQTLDEQQKKLEDLRMALDIERESNEKNLGEAVKMSEKANWLELEVESRNQELNELQLEKDTLLKQLGKLSVDEKVTQYELEKSQREVEMAVFIVR